MSSRICHRAHLIADNGDVSPLCADAPRAINLTRATWTTDWFAVTCKKCLARRDMEVEWKRKSAITRHLYDTLFKGST